MVKKMPARPYAYFRDDQITFLVTHDTDNLTETDLQDFQTDIGENLGGLIMTKVPQAFSFPALKGANIDNRLSELRELEINVRKEDLNKRQEELGKLKSLLSDSKEKDGPGKLQDIKNLLKDKDLQKFLDEVEERASTLKKKISSAYEPKLFRMPFSLLLCRFDEAALEPSALLNNIREFRKNLVGKRFGKLNVEDISPNWLMSVSSQGGATGGPGALPMPFDEKKDGPPLYEFTQLKRALEEAHLYNEGENLDVAILDTAPCAHDLVLAVKEWPEHPLLKTLLGPSGKLIPYHATYEALQRMASTSVNQHDYPMTNHGLFAAGIVHSIVPQAKIHLIEVLNEFGVGDLTSLAEGLALAYDQIYKPGRRLVVNCSWMLELPLSELQFSAPDEDEDAEDDFERAILEYVQEDEDHALTLRTICNNLAAVGGVVAAAGNDKKHAKVRIEKKLAKLMRHGLLDENIAEWVDYLLEYLRQGTPEARYPAAFASVVGVGALPPGPRLINLKTQKYVSSKYSNLGDKPAGDAIMTLGGEEGEDNHQKNMGVLGLYLGGSFPRVTNDPMPGHPHRREIAIYEVKKDDQWAWWAGTSFAAPIVTSTIAAVFGAGQRTTKEAVEVLRDIHHIIEKDGTNALEDVMYVNQG